MQCWSKSCVAANSRPAWFLPVLHLNIGCLARAGLPVVILRSRDQICTQGHHCVYSSSKPKSTGSSFGISGLSEELSWDRTLPRKSRKRRLVDESTIHNRGPVVIASPSLGLNLNTAPTTAETHHLRKRNLAARYLIRLVDHLNNPRSHIKGDLIRQVLVHRNQNITPTPTI